MADPVAAEPAAVPAEHGQRSERVPDLQPEGRQPGQLADLDHADPHRWRPDLQPAAAPAILQPAVERPTVAGPALLQPATATATAVIQPATAATRLVQRRVPHH